MNGSERVILIRGNNSNWYEQAIFIVRKNLPRNEMPMDFVQEAERIINGYMTKPEIFCGKASEKQVTKKAGRKNTGFDTTLNIVMFICIIVLAGILVWSFI